MRLNVYKNALSKEMNDHEVVLSWFLTMAFRELGELDTITLHMTDFKYILFGTGSRKLKMDVLREGRLSKMFLFMDCGDRMAIRIREESMNKNFPGRKQGCMKIDIKDDAAIRIAVYLHAAVNFLHSLVETDTDQPFAKVADEPTRFGMSSKSHFTMQDRLSVENMVGDPNGKLTRKINAKRIFNREI